MTKKIIYRKPGHRCGKCGTDKIDRRAQTCRECRRIKPRNCLGCSKEFLPNKGRGLVGYGKYCSRDCAYKHRLYWGSNQNTKPAEAGRYCKVYFQSCLGCESTFLSRKKTQVRCIRCQKTYQSYKKRENILSIKTTKSCAQCGNSLPKSIGNKIYCNDECRVLRNKNYRLLYKAERTKKDTTSRLCIECRSVFTPIYGDLRKRFCGTECAKSYHYRIVSARRNKRVKAHGAETIDPINIFIRDNWKCNGCGCNTPKKLRGTREDDAPEMDHIVALGVGGSHTIANVQTLCRTCNILKGSMSMEKFVSLYFNHGYRGPIRSLQL